MLFLQGRKDTMASSDLITEVAVAHKKATIYFVEDGDHSFKVPKRAGKSPQEISEEIKSAVSKFIK